MWYEDKFIGKRDLVSGTCYVDKSGIATLYLGKLKDGSLVFYDVMGIILDRGDYVQINNKGDRAREIFPRDKSFVIGVVDDYCKVIMNNIFNYKKARVLSTIPKLLGSACKVTDSRFITAWLTKSNLLGNDYIPEIITDDTKSRNIDEGWIKAKDLKVGCLYHGGQSPWRNTFCYLGRTNSGGYIWFYIGNDEVFKKDPNKCIIENFYGDIEVTKSNKKVRLLTKNKHNFLGGTIIKLSDKTEYFLESRFDKKQK